MKLANVDLKLFLPVLLLLLLGSVVLASVHKTSFPAHLFLVALGLAVFLFFANFDPRVLAELRWPLYFSAVALLVLTLFLGVATRGSVRWISLGFFTLQPSEVVKPMLLLFFSAFLDRSQDLRRFLLAILFFVPAALLILAQPDLGSTLVVAAGFFGVIFLAGIPFSILGAGIASFLVFSPLIWNFLADYQKQRIVSFLNPGLDPLGAGYNSIQSMIAVGSGGVTGRGLGQGTQSQLAFLPERHTDFIFASLSEELGFLGSLLVIVFFAAIFARLARILSESEDPFEKALLGGIFATLFAQAGINIGMNLGILPITGIPLPFVSSGGSSLVAMAAMLGMASSLATQRR